MEDKISQDEKKFQKALLWLVNSESCPPYLKGSFFAPEFPLSYDHEKTRFSKDLLMPDYRADFVEFDARGGLHLWEAKWINDRDLLLGKVIGQLLFYDYLFSTSDARKIASIFEKKGLNLEAVQYLTNSSNLSLSSWNILVCGGCGWELAAGVNPIMHLYSYLGDSYLHRDRQLNLFHLSEINGRYVFKSIWELSIIMPNHMDPEVYSDFFVKMDIDRTLWEYEMKKEILTNHDPSDLEFLRSSGFVEKMLKRHREPPIVNEQDLENRQIFISIAKAVKVLSKLKEKDFSW